MVSYSIGTVLLLSIAAGKVAVDAKQHLRKHQERLQKQHRVLDTALTVIGDELPPGSYGMCQGDCDTDADCANSNLICYQRNGFAPVPGCAGDGDEDTDYCTTRPNNYLYEIGDNLSEGSYGLCEGDCDSDEDCSGDLVCYQRDAYEQVPGCIGWGSAGTDYCYDGTSTPTYSPSYADPTYSPSYADTESSSTAVSSSSDGGVQVFDSGTTGGTSWAGDVLSHVDMNNNPNDLPVAIQIPTNDDAVNYYVGFNDVQVTIVKDTDGQPTLEGALVAGESMTLSNWRGSGLDLMIAVNEIDTDATPASANVDITLENEEVRIMRYCVHILC